MSRISDTAPPRAAPLPEGHASPEAERAPSPAAAKNAKAFEYYPGLGRVRDHVLLHLGEEITLADAAEIAGLEYHHFSRVFHERIGYCFREWLCALRVARAMELLSQRNLEIAWVGSSVGFADRRSLQRAFQRWVGMTPRQYRALVRPAAGTGGEAPARRPPAASARAGDENPARLYSPRGVSGSAR